jgi:hypothetical protein
MSMWAGIVLIVLIVSIAQVIKAKHNAQAGFATDDDGNPVGPSPREKELHREVEQLRERVKVLERIATEGRETRLLADEIDKLRDN